MLWEVAAAGSAAVKADMENPLEIGWRRGKSCLREERLFRSQPHADVQARQRCRGSPFRVAMSSMKAVRPQLARSALVHGPAAVDDKRHGFRRDAGSGSDLEDGRSARAGVRRIELAMEGFGFGGEDILADKCKMLADFRRRHGKQGRRSDPACLASGCMRLAMFLAVRPLVGHAQDRQGPVRELVLRQLRRAELIGIGNRRLMGRSRQTAARGRI